jgi:hypothetical protein
MVPGWSAIWPLASVHRNGLGVSACPNPASTGLTAPSTNSWLPSRDREKRPPSNVAGAFVRLIKPESDGNGETEVPELRPVAELCAGLALTKGTGQEWLPKKPSFILPLRIASY